MQPLKEVDVLVCGGGPAGVAAALMAARGGATTLLVERYGRLGGAAVNNLVNPLMGGVASPLAAEISRRFAESGGDYGTLDLVYAEMLQEAGVSILLHSWAFEAVRQGNRVTGVRFLSKQGIYEIRAKITVDATGDGDVAALAGAEYEQGREGDGRLQPMTIMFWLGGIDKSVGLLCGSEEEAMQVRVPEGIWHDVVHQGIARGELPPNVGIIRVYEANRPGERCINATQVNGVDGTNVEDLTRAELEGRRQALQVRNFMRKHAPGYENCFVSQMPQSIGVRETRRFLGLNYLSREDLVAGRKWDTAVVRDANFVIDIHNPAGPGQAHGFAEKAKPYDIPYGCLVPRTVDGLLLAGRCISGSHEAHASYRVQRIVQAIGAAAGAAAAIATAQRLQPRDVPVNEIQDRLGITPAKERKPIADAIA